MTDIKHKLRLVAIERKVSSFYTYNNHDVLYS